MRLTDIKNVVFFQHLKRYFLAGWLPMVLTLLFVVQNQAYNRWLNVIPNFYFVRRTAVTLALGTLLYGPAALFKKYGRYAYLFLVSVIISLIFVAQFLYYEYSGGFLQSSVLRYAGQAGDLSGTIKTLLTPKLFLFIANPLIIIVAAVLACKNMLSNVILSAKEKIGAVILILLVVFCGYGALLAAEKKDWGDTTRLYSKLYDLGTVVGKMGIINFSLEDLARLALRANRVTAADEKFLQTWVQARQTPVLGPKFSGLAKGRNLIIIQVESLENADLNQKIGNQEIAPNLNKLAKEGMYFPNYYALIGPGNTADTEFVTMDSLYPLPDDVAFISYAENQYSALPKLLDDSGYHTYVLHGDVPTFWNRSNAYPSLGYQQWIGKDSFTAPRPVGFDGLGDSDFFDQSAAKLKNLQQPFSATLITLSSHSPFELPDDLQTLSMPAQTNLNHTQQEYLQSIHYTDRAIGSFIDQLKKNGLYDNSLIVIYGDHGSFTGIGDALGAYKNIPQNLHNSQVPLILLAPGTNLQGINTEPASDLDLFPTLTNLLGLIPSKSILGQDALNTKNPAVAHRNNAGVIDTILTDSLIFEAPSDGVFEHGQCLSLPGRDILPVDNCKTLYNQQSDTVRASDIVIKGNLLHLLLKP